MTMTADRPSTGMSSFGLNPQDELNDLRMSEKALPLLNKVKDFIREVVEPASEEFHRLGEGRPDVWQYAPGQLEIVLHHRADALRAVDEAIMYKRLVRGVAAKHAVGDLVVFAVRAPRFQLSSRQGTREQVT